MQEQQAVVMNKIPNQEYAQYYSGYVAHYDGQPILPAMVQQLAAFEQLVGTVTRPISYRYADGKWTIAELLLHIIDTERVFQYRAFAFSRGEKQTQPGFEQDDYVATSRAAERTMEDILTEYQVVRQSTIALFRSLGETELSNIGTASGNPVSVRALGYIILGHSQHHMNILSERYFV